MKPAGPTFLRVREAAAILGISASAAYELVNTWLSTDGQTGLPAVRLGRTIRIPRVAIDRLAAVGGVGDGDGTGGVALNQPPMPAPVPGPHDGPAVVVSTASRTLRRQLRPLVWVALEEVALAAVAEGGRLVARTSARQVAEQLGLDAGTAALALRALRQRGLLVLEREKGPAGRFGLSVYVLGPVGGLTVLSPRTAEPHMDEQGAGRPHIGSQPVEYPKLVSPDVEKPCLARPDGAARELAPPHTGRPTMVRPGTAAPGLGAPSTTAPRPGQPPVHVPAEVAPATAVPQRSGTPAQPSPPSPQCPGQEAFEL